jgi:mRNA interferase RelE/StbE
MPHQVRFSKIAEKQYRTLPVPARLQLKPKIDALATDPRPYGAKPLRGIKNLFRIRTGDYRIVYQVLDAELVVLIVKIGDRKTIYRRLMDIS